MSERFPVCIYTHGTYNGLDFSNMISYFLTHDFKLCNFFITPLIYLNNKLGDHVNGRSHH